MTTKVNTTTKTNTSRRTRYMVELALMIAIIFIMAFTPLGYLKTPGLSITFLTVPVAVGAMILGPKGGAICGFAFGITSLIQCFGTSAFGAMLLGTSRFVAAEYSFFLSIPVMFGASFLKLVKYGFHYTGMEVTILVVGMLVAFIVSIVAIKFLLGYIKKNDFKAFGVYRIVLGIVVAAYFLFVK